MITHENQEQGPSQFDLVLYRTGEVYRHPRGAQGIRGKLITNPRSSLMMTFDTLERGDNYKHLPTGEYDCEFAYWSYRYKDQIKRVKAIRVLGEYSRGNHPDSRGRIYFHPANWPHQLKGCIAVGLDTSDKGVKGSRDALLTVFDQLGGYTGGFDVRPIRLLVRLPTTSERVRLPS